jgi:asparagine synthase (glutamine-hydrolysing)
MRNSVMNHLKGLVRNAYRQWGADCLPKLNGMWAFIVYDRTERRLFGSRDRFGVKPLYVHRKRNQVLFVSEIRAIRASGLYQGGVNWKVASRFLIEGNLDGGGGSFYEGIDPIPPGSASSWILAGHGSRGCIGIWIVFMHGYPGSRPRVRRAV